MTNLESKAELSFVSAYLNLIGQSNADDNDDSDDIPQLSAHTLAALQEFYNEEKEKQEKEASGGNIDMEENWQLSQFWYDDDTAFILAKEALRAANYGRIACLCAPTLYKKLAEVKPLGCDTKIFEFDKRFAVFGEDFVFYDYKNPLDLPNSVKEHSFDLVFADPPFLSEECLTKTAQTIKYLTKEKIILCTGQVMEDVAYRLLEISPCKFQPKHARNLGNQFACFVNYESELNK
ncbi:EEF1A lysine methyltransferase 1-like isoform X1 [Montipora capricornis]|uniref:EEF1A lysine methyltransferase 1-like isoform X1 n=1 Tax=Montipora capricornis TaxID=246305 RepID=UPI0035F16406